MILSEISWEPRTSTDLKFFCVLPMVVDFTWQSLEPAPELQDVPPDARSFMRQKPCKASVGYAAQAFNHWRVGLLRLLAQGVCLLQHQTPIWNL